jgi:predicted RNase H-like HicB family nuclease
MEYIAYLHKDQDSDYGVSFPDLPGCVTAGKTLEQAQRMAREALALHLAGMVEDGDAIPEASHLDDLASDPARRDALCFLVAAEVRNRVLRVNITAKESQLRKIDELAAAADMTRSTFMVRAALQEGQLLSGLDRWVRNSPVKNQKISASIQAMQAEAVDAARHQATGRGASRSAARAISSPRRGARASAR